MKIYVYDDEAALNVIAEVVMWIDEDDSELYTPSQWHAHLNELPPLKLDVKAQNINILQPDWF